jgi:hypothetical protein
VKKLLGFCTAAAGLFIVIMQVLWTTGEKRDLPFLPPFGEKALVFSLGMTGLALVYLGYRLMRRP